MTESPKCTNPTIQPIYQPNTFIVCWIIPVHETSLSCDKEICNYYREWTYANDFTLLAESTNVVIVRTCNYKDIMSSWWIEHLLDGCRVWNQSVCSRRVKALATWEEIALEKGHPWRAGFFLSCNYTLAFALKLEKIAENLRTYCQKLPGKISSGKMVYLLPAASNVLLISSRLRSVMKAVLVSFRSWHVPSKVPKQDVRRTSWIWCVRQKTKLRNFREIACYQATKFP